MLDCFAALLLFAAGFIGGHWWKSRDIEQHAEARVAFWQNMAGMWKKAARDKGVERACQP